MSSLIAVDNTEGQIYIYIYTRCLHTTEARSIAMHYIPNMLFCHVLFRKKKTQEFRQYV